MSKIKILVVEDEIELNKMICDFLKENGYQTFSETNGKSAITLLTKHTFDILLLDIMLPGADGNSVLKSIQGQSLPGVIMISAKNLESDKLKTFSAGADDYLTKPFSFHELDARIKALIRRLPIKRYSTNLIINESLKVDEGRRKIFLNDKELKLTFFQYNLFRNLILYPARVFSREELLNLEEDSSLAFDRTIDVQIKNIRKELGENFKLIETIRGVGYRYSPKSRHQ